MNFIFEFFERLIVSKCPSCGRIVKYSGTLCSECFKKYEKERSIRCPFCALSARECECSTRGLKYTDKFGLALYSVLFYDPECEVFGELLYNLKRNSDRGAEKFLARELSAEIMKLMAVSGEFVSDWYITYPPRARKSKLKYGFDHAEGLARRISEYTGIKFEKNVFTHKGAVSQKELDFKGRKMNARFAFSLSDKAEPKGKKYIIVDDIITSGATVGKCQELLISAGAAAAFPVSVSKTYRCFLSHDTVRRRSAPGNAWFNS